MTGTVLCFGEMLLRLAAPDRGHLFQEARLDAHFGGAEANVAVALARLGSPAALVTTLPYGLIGDAALETVRAAGVDVSRVKRTDGRLGLYFLSPSSGARHASIIYDRLDTSFALAPTAIYDWEGTLDGVEWLHLSGIIPAIGPGAARLSLDAIAAARQRGVRISFDGNYRTSMWARWGAEPQSILIEHVAAVDLLIGNHRDISLLLGQDYCGDTPQARRAACEAAFRRFPQLKVIASTSRGVVGGNEHRLSARVDRRNEWFETEAVTITGIVDRIGTGDAFAAGVLSVLDEGCASAAERGLVLAALKHATMGDQSRTTIAEVNGFTSVPGDVRR
jgi:2-dehydro-3-deoxygluconokinase